MTSEPYPQWDLKHVWHPYTRASSLDAGPLPLIVRGEGIHLIDSDGRRYVDAISSWWCCSLGHGHPRIVAAIQRQAEELQHSILGNLSHPQAAELAARLAGLMPDAQRHVLFASDGASAVEQALKIAVQYGSNIGRPERHRFACLQGAYHGDTLGAMGVGYLEDWHRPFKSLLAPAISLPLPHELQVAGFRFQVWQKILDQHANELAAVIVEPLCLGAAGMRMYPAALLKELADWCRAHEVLLIDDEIAMGFGRTGRLFAFEHAGVDPDIVCVGKALSAGYLPISATIVRDSIYASFRDRPMDHTLQHGHTFCGNPIAAAAANEALRVYAEMNIAQCAAGLGEVLAHLLQPLRQHARVKDVRCLGLIGAVELNAEASPGAVTLPHRIRLALQARGILLRPLGNVLYLMPPLVIEEKDLRALAGEFVAAIADTP